MKLLVDIGNSRVKWARADADGLAGPWAFNRGGGDPAAGYAAAWDGLAPDAVAACSVAGRQAVAGLRDWVAARWGLEVVELRPGDRLGGVVNGYRDPAALGADRWANLIGAHALLGPADAVLVDAGTAVTVDALRADGRHAGGAILAGLAAGRAGLRTAAPALPAPSDDATLPAVTTAGAMGAGTLVGLAGAIERVADQVGTGLPAPRRIITGGDAAALLPWLGPGWEHDPLLTLRGLRAAVEAPCAG